jgi:hypothetical protein
LANGGSNISRSLKLLCLKRTIGNLSAFQEKSGYLLRQRGNELFFGKPEVILGPDLFGGRVIKALFMWRRMIAN